MKRPERLLRRKGVPLLAFALLLGLLATTGVFDAVEDGAYAAGMRLSAPRRASERFAVILIDVNAARQAGDWPWPGPRFGELITRISNAEARAIAWMLPPDPEAASGVTGLLDTLESSLPPDAPQRETLVELRQRLDPNSALVAAFAANDKTLLGVPPGDRRNIEAERQLMPYRLPHVVDDINTITLPAGFRPPVFPPLEYLRNGFDAPKARSFSPQSVAADLPAAAAGVALVPAAAETWRQPLAWQVNGVHLPSLPLLMAATARERGLADLLVYRGHGVAVGADWLSTSPALEALPYFYPDEPSARLSRYSARQLLDGEIDASALRDKVVLVGLLNDAVVDTPMGAMPHPVAVAQAAASLYSGDIYVRPAWTAWFSALLWLLIGAWVLFAIPKLQTRNALIGTTVIAALILIVELALLVSQSLWMPMTAPVLALLLGHVVLHGHRWLHERRAAQARAVSDAYLSLGEALRAQGQLDRAFDALQNCLPGETVERQLHDLGLDYERKRHYAKALRVYHQLKLLAPAYPEVDARINRLHTLEEQSLRSRRSSGPIETVAMEEAGMRKPRIGRFDIQRELGRGAMGVVYLGKDIRIGREVAIKTLAFGDEFSGDALDDVKMRFFREAEAAGRLSHPNIVTIYDVGEEDDLAYIAMDYLRGEVLSQHIKEATLLPIPRVLKIAAHVADALHYAHEQGVVHRDVKPANMVLTLDEHEVKVADFGVAHLMDASKTRTGTILGSPSFMSPEQVAGTRVDGRSDLWSLGVSMYQLLTGHLPFTGEPLATLMYRIANEPHNELRGWRPDIPDCVEAIINKALTKDPSARYQTGRGMAGAIRQCVAKLADRETTKK